METSNENTNIQEVQDKRPQAPTAKTYNARTQFATKTVSDWEKHEVVPLKGEMTVAIPDNWDGNTPFNPIIKIGDGVNYWKDLKPMSSGGGVEVLKKSDSTVTDEEFINANIDEKTLVDGLYIIVESEGEMGTQHTAYIYDVNAEGEGRLIALSGNYNADNVYFDSDITLAGDYTAVGNVKLNEGTLQSKGKSVSELFDQIFTKELQPTITNPSMTVTLNEAKQYEVGTEVVPTYTTTFNKGKYSFGPTDTGVVVEGYSVTFNGETLTTEKGSFQKYIVTETPIQISATINYSDGVEANTNLGNTSKECIKGGSCNATSGNITGVRYNFWGKNGQDVTLKDLTSTIIRGYNTTTGSFSIPTVGTGINNIIVAVKQGQTIKKVIMPVSNNADVTTEFKNIGTIDVGGANGNLPVPYTIYKYQPATLDAKSDFEITIG